MSGAYDHPTFSLPDDDPGISDDCHDGDHESCPDCYCPCHD